MTDQLIEDLKRDEGLRLMPYRDAVGKLTIGYGRNLEAEGISAAEAEMMLANDVAKFRAQMLAALPWAKNLDQPRQNVLVNMAFNMGIYGLLAFKETLALLEAGNYEAAASAMLASKWAEQVGDRAKRLAAVIGGA